MTFLSGVLVVGLLHSTGAVGGSGDHVLSGTVDIVLGALLLIAWAVLRRRPPAAKDGGRARTERLEQNRWVLRLMRSPGLAVVLGAALYAPSPIYLAALKTVTDSGLPLGKELAWVLGLTVIVTSMIEIPVVLMLRRPERGRSILEGVNAWLSRNGHAIGLWALFAVGAYLLVRGVARVA
jgi:hypothetical protein